MKWFRNLRVFYKLLVSFFFLVSIVIACGFYATSLFKRSNSQSIDLIEKWLPGIKYVGMVHDHTSELNKMQYKLLLFSMAKADSINVIYKDVKEILGHLERDEINYNLMHHEIHEDKLHADFLISFKEFLKVHSKILTYIETSKNDSALYLLNNEAAVYFSDFNQKLGKLTEYYEANIKSSWLEANAVFEKSITSIVILILLLIILLITYSIIISKQISKPLEKLYHATNNIINGNYNFILHSSSKDEIGKLSDNFALMSVKINEKIAELENTNRHLDEKVKERTVKLEKANELLKFSNEEMQSLNEELRANEEELQQNIDFLNDANKQLDESKSLFSSLVNTSRDFVFIIDASEKLLFASPASEKILGYTPDELLDGRNIIINHLTDESRNKFNNAVTKCYSSELPSDEVIELEWKQKSGGIVYTEALFAKIYFKKQSEVFLQVILHDISSRRKTLIDLQNLKAAVEQSANTIVITDTKGNIEFVNRAFVKTTGYTAEEALGKNPRILKTKQTLPETYKELWNTISSGKEWHGEFLNKKKNGELYWEWATIAPIKDSNGKILRYIAIKENITEKKQMEEHATLLAEELRIQSNKLEQLNASLKNEVKSELEKNREKDRMLLMQSRQAAMGEMIGNIAHQWRQPLNSLNLMIFDLLDSYNHNELDKKYLEESSANMKKVIQHMSQTIEDFRGFFKPEKEAKEFNLNEIINRSVSFVSPRCISRGIEIIKDVSDDITILGYANEYSQVVLNILNNALDAIEINEIQNGQIKIYSAKDSSSIKLFIKDNAGGIPLPIIYKIFDPYFTTKDEGKGTGVGLYMSKTIIEKNMNGRLLVKNEDNGAVFVIETKVAKEHEHIG